MNTDSCLKAKNQIVFKIGFWSSLLTGVLNLWYFIAFALYQPILYAPWKGIDAYAASFDQLPFLAWVIPCFFLPLAFLIMIIAVYESIDAEDRIWGLMALIFAMIYTAVSCTNYYIQMAIVRYNLINNQTDGLSLWLYANYYPHSIPGALEGIGYFFTCLALLCAAQIFRRGRLERSIHWLFITTGILGMVVFTDLLYKIPLILTLIDVVIVGVLLTVGPVLLAVLFRRRMV